MSPTLSLMCEKRAMMSTPSQPVTTAPVPIETAAVALMPTNASAVPTLTKPAPRPSALEVTLMPWPLCASGFVSSSEAFFGTVASRMTRSAISDALSPIVVWLVPPTFVDECAFASAPKPPPFASLFEEALTAV